MYELSGGDDECTLAEKHDGRMDSNVTGTVGKTPRRVRARLQCLYTWTLAL